jgi:hypothetical protein
MGLKLVLTGRTGDFQVVGNTHSYPIGGVENWYQKNDKPKGYLGWRGRIEGKIRMVKRMPGSHGNDVDLNSVIGRGWSDTYTVGFTFRGFHSGTGCPAKNFSVSYDMFIDDFPKIRDRYKTLCLTHGVACRLAGSTFRNKEFNDFFQPKYLLENSKCSTAR